MPYLTPDIDDLNGSPDCRTITVSGDLWLYVSGALSELEKIWNWEEAGTATPEQMADYFKTVNDDYAISQCGGAGMNLLTSGVQLYSGNGTNGNPPQIQILKSSLSSELADMVGGVVNIKSSVDEVRILTAFPYGNASLQTFHSLPAADNNWIQFILPFDATGAKINIGGFGTPTYWNYYIDLIGWW